MSEVGLRGDVCSSCAVARGAISIVLSGVLYVQIQTYTLYCGDPDSLMQLYENEMERLE